METLIAYTDGGSRKSGAGCGVVYKKPIGHELRAPFDAAFGIGKATNNEAEYKALIYALRATLAEGWKNLRVFADSQLMVCQMNGEYTVRAETIIPLYEEAIILSSKLERFEIFHIPRERNAEADKLANDGMDEQERKANVG